MHDAMHALLCFAHNYHTINVSLEEWKYILITVLLI